MVASHTPPPCPGRDRGAPPGCLGGSGVPGGGVRTAQEHGGHSRALGWWSCSPSCPPRLRRRPTIHIERGNEKKDSSPSQKPTPNSMIVGESANYFFVY